jgi:hypothetical protein
MAFVSTFQASAVQNTMRISKTFAVSLSKKYISASKRAMLRNWLRLNGEYIKVRFFVGVPYFFAHHDGNNSASHQTYCENAAND